MPTRRMLEASGGSPTFGDCASAGASMSGVNASASQRGMAESSRVFLVGSNLSIRSPPWKRGSSTLAKNGMPACAGMSGRALRIHIPPIHRNRLPGHEIAFRRSQKYQRAEEILRLHIALERARRDGAAARGLYVAGVLLDYRVGEREAGHQRIDANAVIAELARHRARHRHDPALARNVMHQPRDAAPRR